MTFEEAATQCPIGWAIYRESNPYVRYWRDGWTGLYVSVPRVFQADEDWAIFDPSRMWGQ